MTNEQYKNVPPDGGWGWFIVLASALNGISTIPIMQGFGLIFKDTFPRLGFSATDASIIINTNLAFGMLLGLANGPLLQHFGYRKVAIVGSLIYTTGVTLTAFAQNFMLIMVSYGILASLGMGVTMSAFSYALNSYFTTRRGRAAGFTLTIVGLGPIFMPHATSYLISSYGFQGTMMLYGSFTLHSLIGAALLQPVRRHWKKVSMRQVDEHRITEKPKLRNCQPEHEVIVEEDESTSITDLKHSENKPRTTMDNNDNELEASITYRFKSSTLHQVSKAAKNTNSRKNQSTDSINLGSSLKIFEEYHSDIVPRYYSVEDLSKNNHSSGTQSEDSPSQHELPQEPTTNSKDDIRRLKRNTPFVRRFKRVVNFYDLTLLQDPVYVNIMVGMSIAIFAEVNFSLLTPFILSDMQLSTTDIATVMSVLACVDLVSRSSAPFLGECLGLPPRLMYLFSLLLLILSRTLDGFTPVLLVAVGLGAAKGIRSVYMTLVLPSYVPIERLPYASGIQMIVNGVILMSAGPILGLIRDSTGSYTPCIVLMNLITAVAVVLWSCELFVIPAMKFKRKPQKVDDKYLLRS